MKKGYPMGKVFNSHFGYVELPSEILEVGIFDSHLEFNCVDGVYHVCKKHVPEEGLIITKVFERKLNNDNNYECEH